MGALILEHALDTALREMWLSHVFWHMGWAEAASAALIIWKVPLNTS
jgi:hypothetical protein